MRELSIIEMSAVTGGFGMPQADGGGGVGLYGGDNVWFYGFDPQKPAPKPTEPLPLPEPNPQNLTDVGKDVDYILSHAFEVIGFILDVAIKKDIEIRTELNSTLPEGTPEPVIGL